MKLVEKAMGGKDYLTKDDFIYTTQMVPNLHWTEDQAEQTLYQLLQEGKVLKLGDDKYQPTEKLNLGEDS